MSNSIYTDGSYLEATEGTWHLEDAAAKANWICEMLSRQPQFQPKSICEIGSGAGGILAELQKSQSAETRFVGYEISPQAHEMSRQFENQQCEFVLGDAFADGRFFDLVLIMDVIEHVEDCFAFLRKIKEKGRYKIYNVPLDTSASFAVRGFNEWDSVGHIHLFTAETALKSIEYSGQKVLDWKFAPSSFERQERSMKTSVMNAARSIVSMFHEKLAVRLLGGYSLLVFAE